MISSSQNRVQAIKCKFENLKSEPDIVTSRNKLVKNEKQCKPKLIDILNSEHNIDKENACNSETGSRITKNHVDLNNFDDSIQPNTSYLYGKDIKKNLVRQVSDPGKKLQRSHAFRCDRSKKIGDSPKRHDSCNGRTDIQSKDETEIKINERKLSLDRLKKLGNVLETHMKKENFISPLSDGCTDKEELNVPYTSISDENTPQHILNQYSQVVKKKKRDYNENKNDAATDSGVSSETENLDEDKFKRKLDLENISVNESNIPLENPSSSNLVTMKPDVYVSCESIKLERKNPHVVLTDTLKKALKQPLPAGPPPKKPPRIFATSPILEEVTPKKKDTKQMLEKLEQVLQQREEKKSVEHIYDVAETNLSLKKPKEVHYLCTEILDITQRTLLPNQNKDAIGLNHCFKSLNCANISHSTLSIPYDKTQHVLSSSFPIENQNKSRMSTFFPSKSLGEHIYDIPFTGNSDVANSFVQTSVSDDRNVINKCKSGNTYGVVRPFDRLQSKSLEELPSTKENEQKIYDIPDLPSRASSPETAKTEFDRLRSTFENTRNAYKKNTFKETEQKIVFDRPTIKPKPIMSKIPSDSKLIVSKSTNNLNQEFRNALNTIERSLTKHQLFRKNDRNDSSYSGIALTIARKDKKDQLDMDKENLNRLMNEIYDTVTAACRMDDVKPSRFPTEAEATIEDSVKLTRSLTEKRKNYVRRVSSKSAYLDTKLKTRYRHQTSICSYKSDLTENNYSTFRTWKSFRHSQNNLNKSESRIVDLKMADAAVNMTSANVTDSTVNLTDSFGNSMSMKDDLDLSVDSLSIDNKAGCLDLDLPFERRSRGLFDVCLLVGLNHMTGEAYVKSVFPSQVKVPPHIENLVFPETISSEGEENKINYELSAIKTQNYSLVLTDEKGDRNYGYCRRVLPEGALSCLPLSYCIISRYRAPGFYYKILKEIESQHGDTEIERNTILQQLFDSDFPLPGEEFSLHFTTSTKLTKNPYRNSVNLGDIQKCQTMPGRKPSGLPTEISKCPSYVFLDEREKQCSDKQKNNNFLSVEFLDLENNNTNVFFSVDKSWTKVLKRPIEPRVDENNLSVLLDSFGAGLLIKVFASLLLERKVVIISDNLCQLSSCMEGLQSILYPFVWQQPLISVIPSRLRRDIMEAPLPILAGSLGGSYINDGGFEEGMLIDISNDTTKVILYQGDESTILPSASYKTLKTTLQMETVKNQQEKENGTRNIMISEAFLRFFVNILKKYWNYLSFGILGEGVMGKAGVVFDRVAFIKSDSSKQNQYFLEWFSETAMFNHFIQNMAVCYANRNNTEITEKQSLVDAPLPNFYELFEERLQRNKYVNKSIENNNKTNYKNAVNKKVKQLRTKLKDLIT